MAPASRPLWRSSSEERAARNFELTIDQSDALISKLSTELRDRVGISQDVIRRILGLIESQMDALAKVDQNSPRLAVSRANMLSAFVENYIELGDLQKAKERAEECADIVRPLRRAGDKDFDVTQQARGLPGNARQCAGGAFAVQRFDQGLPGKHRLAP